MEETSRNNKIYVSIDQALLRVGEFGLYQQVLDCILCIMTIPIAYQMVLMYFVTLNPSWECVNNTSICNINGTLPHDDTRRCHMPREEWKYTEPDDYSIVTEFDIHCDKEWILYLTTSIMFVGWAVGSFILGWLGDKYGRKSVLFPSMTAVLLVGFISSFLSNIYLIILARFIIGLFCPGTVFVMFVLISECVGCKQRPLAGLLIWLTLPVSICILVLKAYFIRKWKILNMVCTGPYIVLLAFYKFIPESIRWLEVQGKVDDILIIIRKIGKWNKSDLPQNMSISLPKTIPVQKSNPLNLFRSRKFVLQSLSLGVIWMVIAMGYFGLYIAADDLGGSVYLDMFILAVSEIPASFFAIDFCDRFGRKGATLYTLLAASISCISIFFIPSYGQAKIMKLIMGMLGKLSIAISFSTIATWSVEILPVNLRVGGMGFMQVCSRIGYTSAPWIEKGLNVLNKGTPFVVMGTFALIGFIVGLWLPETKPIAFIESNVEGMTNVAGVHDEKEDETVAEEDV